MIFMTDFNGEMTVISKVHQQMQLFFYVRLMGEREKNVLQFLMETARQQILY